jgi:putative membrane protein
MMVAFCKGFLIGLANIIPGVSGGTLALILGIYKRIVVAIHNIGLPLVRAGLLCMALRPGSLARLRDELERIDAVFLGLLGAGAVTAILATSRLMSYLLDHHYVPSYAFFWGLVLASMIFPYRYLKRRRLRELVAFLLAGVLTVSLAFAMDEEDRIEKVRRKQALEQAEVRAERTAGIVSLAHPGAARLGVVFLSAALAISAMILPGISGSFVLLLSGVYFDILTAINNRQIVVLGVFCAGLGMGLLVFSRLMNVLLERFYNVTMAFMIGLMAGSLYILWPFKRTVWVGVETVYLGNSLPDGFGPQVWQAALAMLVGAGIVLGFYAVSRKRGFAEL